MISFDHIQIAALDPKQSAIDLANILGVAKPIIEGRDNDLWRIDLNNCFVLFSEHSAPVPFTHAAFKVDEKSFQQIIERLKKMGIPYGNDHEDPANSKTEDQLGGNGRVYWLDRDKHLLEITY
jgi:hypothetical protein